MRYNSRPVSLYNAGLQVWPLAGVCSLGTDFPTTLMDWNGLLVLNFLYKVIYADHLLSFWNSGILLCARQSVST